MSTASLLDELHALKIRLTLTADGGLRWEAAEQPSADLLARAGANREGLRQEMAKRREADLARYHELEGRLERNLWDYAHSACSPVLHAAYVADIVDIDLVEKTLRTSYGVKGCISGYGRCTEEQRVARLCCDACRGDGKES